jgi:hypothetical protein
MDAGKHEAMKPSLLYAERLEYREFPLRIFRDHIYQEKRNKLPGCEGKKSVLFSIALKCRQHIVI